MLTEGLAFIVRSGQCDVLISTPDPQKSIVSQLGGGSSLIYVTADSATLQARAAPYLYEFTFSGEESLCACADEGGDITVTAAVYVSAALDAELTSITLESDAALVAGATMRYSVAPVRLSSYFSGGGIVFRAPSLPARLSDPSPLFRFVGGDGWHRSIPLAFRSWTAQTCRSPRR